jgi:hypothetical protein
MSDPTSSALAEMQANPPSNQAGQAAQLEGAGHPALTTSNSGLSQIDEADGQHQPKSNSMRSSTRSVRSSRSRSRSGRSVSSVNSSSSPSHHVVYSTVAKYDQWVCMILIVPLALIVIQIIAKFIATKVAKFERSGEVWIMLWVLILILGLYMMVLPKQVDIRSNGTIGIKTFLITYTFDDICHVYLAGLGAETFVGQRYRFATCLDPTNQVVIRRRGTKWDLVVSPDNADEFLRMMQSLITKLEIQKGSGNAETSLDGESGGSSTENIAIV